MNAKFLIQIEWDEARTRFVAPLAPGQSEKEKLREVLDYMARNAATCCTLGTHPQVSVIIEEVRE